MIPLVRGTVESHRIPSNAAKIKTVTSVLGRKINTKNKSARSVYKMTRRFFFEFWSPKWPKYNVPNTLNKPIKASDQEPIHKGNERSVKYAGKWVATNETWKPHTKKPTVSNT